jgi:hypothetical protein
MSGRRTSWVAALLGVVVLAVVALFLVQEMDVPPAPHPSAGVSRPAPSHPEPAPSSPGPALPSPPPASPRDPPASAPDSPPVPPEGLLLEGFAVGEDGTPLGGVRFLELVRGEDGSPEILLERTPNDSVESDTGGKFSLRWERRPPEVLLLVLMKDAELAAAEGGALLDPLDAGPVVRADPPRALRLVFRPRPGTARVRVVDDATGAVLSGRGDVRLRWRDAASGRFLGAFLEVLRGAGQEWIAVRGPEREKDPALPAPEPVLEVRSGGYEAVRVPLAEVRGDVEVRLAALRPDVYGEARPPGVGGKANFLGLSLVHLGQGPADTPQQIPRQPGFAFGDVADGKWVLYATAITGDGIRWARRPFEKAGAPVDLGTFEVSGWSGFRARVLGPDGKPLRLPVLATSPEGGRRADVHFLVASGEALRGAAVVDEGGELVVLDRGRVPSRTPDAEGWVEIRDLCPGAPYRLYPEGMEGAAVEATAPEATGEFRTVEIRSTLRPVRCLLRLTVKGEAPEEWGPLIGGSAARSPWGKDGNLRADLFPGRHDLSVLARARGSRGFLACRGEFEVPDQESFEASVDLK